MTSAGSSLMMRPRVLIADDHALLREAFHKLLEADCEIVGSVADGRALVALAHTVKPDLILVDVAMPLLNGVDAAAQLKRTMPLVKVIFLTVNDDPDLAKEAFRIGASGYLLKNSSAAELLDAIACVWRGERYISPAMTQGMMESFIHAPQGRNLTRHLTSRQREVLQLLAEGHSMKAVAGIMHITPRTVAFHKYRMMEDLGLKTNAALLQFAVAHGLAPEGLHRG